MKSYEGIRNEHYILIVRVNGVPLNSRLDLLNKSPMGFECGHAGLGAAQLALAILADYLNDDKRAMSLYRSFKWEVVAKLQRSGWRLTGNQIQHAINSIN